MKRLGSAIGCLRKLQGQRQFNLSIAKWAMTL